MGAVSYKGYVANVEFDFDTEALVGRVVNARVPLDFTTTAAGRVLSEFRKLIDAYLAGCEADGVEPVRPYSGKLLLRIAPHLHSTVAAEAARVGWSINAWVEHAVRRTLDESPARSEYDLD